MKKSNIINRQQTNGYLWVNGIASTTTTAPSIGYWQTSGGSSITATATNTPIFIGNGQLSEENGELIWIRPDGTKCILTGKADTFKKLYDKLEDENI